MPENQKTDKKLIQSVIKRNKVEFYKKLNMIRFLIKPVIYLFILCLSVFRQNLSNRSYVLTGASYEYSSLYPGMQVLDI